MDRQIGLELLGGMVGLGLGLSCAILAALRGIKAEMTKHLEYMIKADNERILDSDTQTRAVWGAIETWTAESKDRDMGILEALAELKPPQPRKSNGEFTHKPKGWTELSKGLEAGTIPVIDKKTN